MPLWQIARGAIKKILPVTLYSDLNKQTKKVRQKWMFITLNIQINIIGSKQGLHIMRAPKSTDGKWTMHLKGKLRIWNNHTVAIRHIIWIKFNFKKIIFSKKDPQYTVLVDPTDIVKPLKMTHTWWSTTAFINATGKKDLLNLSSED